MAENNGTATTTGGNDTSGQPQDKAAPTNLIDAAAPAPSAPDASSQSDWFWSDGVKGADKPPEWFDGKKYKNVAEQARALPESRKRIGALESQVNEMTGKLKAFAGAPEKYEVAMPDELKEKIEWKTDDPLLVEFQSLCKESGVTQDFFAKCISMLAKHEYTNLTPDWGQVKAAIGERADERLRGFTEWYQGTMDDETAGLIKVALGINPSPADVFRALEAVRGAGRAPAGLHTPNDDVPAGGQTVADINRKYRTPDPNTKKALIDTPDGLKKYRAEIAAVVGSGEHREVVGARKAS